MKSAISFMTRNGEMPFIFDNCEEIFERTASMLASIDFVSFAVDFDLLVILIVTKVSAQGLTGESLVV